MADKIFESDEMQAVRFPCECLFPGHSFDISLELVDKRVVSCSLNLYMDGKSSLKYRLRQMWNLLKGEEGALADFYIRKEDIPEIINLLSRVITSPYTSSRTNFVIEVAYKEG